MNNDIRPEQPAPSGSAPSLVTTPEWWESYSAGWTAAQSLMRRRLMTIVERLGDMESELMSREARALLSEVRDRLSLLVIR